VLESALIMDNKILITKFAQTVLKEKQKELKKNVKKGEKKPAEFAIDLSIWNTKLTEVENILDDCEVIEFGPDRPAMVVIGTRVTLEDLSSGDEREYIIMTRATANPLKGTLSNESPIAQKMMGLKLGNTFKFREIGGQEESYKIKNIE
jgi:transcription elongation GreA/GreB family factor